MGGAQPLSLYGRVARIVKVFSNTLYASEHDAAIQLLQQDGGDVAPTKVISSSMRRKLLAERRWSPGNLKPVATIEEPSAISSRISGKCENFATIEAC